MRYPTIALEDARRTLEALRQGEERRPTVTMAGTGDEEFDVERVEDLAEDVRTTWRAFDRDEDRKRAHAARFEGTLAYHVHSVLELPGVVAADPRFWAWLVFGSTYDVFARVTTWRHGADAPFGAKPENYCVGRTLEDGLYSRAWLRAASGFDARREDPYALVVRGDQDLWRSHILRGDYGMIPVVAKAFLQYLYTDDDPERSLESTAVVREMAKELRRRHATQAFELLDDAAAMALIVDVRASVDVP